MTGSLINLGVVVTTFVVIFPAELPDKTLVATLVLATRFRPLPVWIGVCAAFAVQCVVAVAFGGLLNLLPRAFVLIAAAALFGLGATLMFRGAAHGADDLANEQLSVEEHSRARGRQRIVLTSFLVLFAAEWGDLSQLVTAGLAARYGSPLSVFVGSWLALCSVGGVAALAGRQLARRLPLALVRRSAGLLFSVVGAVTLVEGIRALH